MEIRPMKSLRSLCIRRVGGICSARRWPITVVRPTAPLPPRLPRSSVSATALWPACPCPATLPPGFLCALGRAFDLNCWEPTCDVVTEEVPIRSTFLSGPIKKSNIP